jgi:hypothetical protein
MNIVAPQFGSGLAGGDWKHIAQIIKEVFEDRDITIYVLKPENLQDIAVADGEMRSDVESERRLPLF